MASRAKKKTTDINRQAKVAAKVEKVENKGQTKWSSIYFATTILLFLFIFFIMLLSPVLSGYIKMDIAEYDEAIEVSNFSPSLLDILIAPMRGCTSGLKYIMEESGMLSSKSYSVVEPIVVKYIGQSKVDDLNTLAIVAFVFTIVIDVFFIAMFVMYLLDNLKFKNKVLSLVGSSAFSLVSLAYLVFTLSANIKTIFSSSSVTGGWGIWVILFASLGMLAINIANYIKFRSVTKNENVQKVS